MAKKLRSTSAGKWENSEQGEERGPDQEGIPRGLPKKFFNEEGELDLRRVTGKEAWQYFKAIGCPLPIIQRGH